MKVLTSKKQNGATVVEFTVVATLFFILIFSIIEFGRLLLTWHILNETSRRVARLASVCQVTDSEQADTLLAGVVNSVPLPNFTATNIKVRYLDEFGTEVPLPLTNINNFNQIEFIEASINQYQIDLTIPLATFGLNFTAPDFSTLLPRESLGVTRTGYTDC